MLLASKILNNSVGRTAGASKNQKPRRSGPPHGASAVLVGDFNNDGVLDFAVANKYDSTISILLGRADGSFAPQVPYGTGNYPVSMVAAEFNGDGNIDIAAVDAGPGLGSLGKVSVLLGNGDGTFRSHVDYTTGIDSLGMVAADFNDDNKIDLAVVNRGAFPSLGSISILLGNGDGTFQYQSVVDVGGAPVSISMGDFNDDGKVDLIVSNTGNNSVSVLLSKGDGTFTRVDSSLDSFPGALAVGDVNGDGLPDILVVTFYSRLELLSGNGNGTFQPAVNITLPTNFPITNLALGDFNNDGKLDIAVGTAVFNSGLISILAGNGDGTFLQAINNVAPATSSLIVGDFDGDGNLDVAETYSGSQMMYVLLGNGAGSLRNYLKTL